MSLTTQDVPVRHETQLHANRPERVRRPTVNIDRVAIAVAVAVAIATFVIMALTAV